MPLDDYGLRAFLDQYFDVFAACARGERELADLLRFFGLPVILTSQDGVTTATTDDEALAIMLGGRDALRAAGYHRTIVLRDDMNIINAVSALCTATFSHRDRAGGEIDKATITFLVTETSAGLKISVRAVHG
jgi:hypothetical protein